MSTYEVEHNTTDPSTSTSARRRRPDLSTFFATLSEISPDETGRSRPHAVPVPHDVSAAFYSLAEAFEVMRREGPGIVTPAGSGDGETGAAGGDGGLLTEMIQSLLNQAEMPPREVEGVSEEFCDVLLHIPTLSTYGLIASYAGFMIADDMRVRG
ncbi:hypothetical protein N8T08_003100 [Aspergillus melleus]|uniref:Uncharacterized protein n=1 Tax=Aspergillus melleus TaxID=138277 RepID=A0ACC3B7A3_9EURO|nr:hypothetical protein N8T08_003100 [Aspergillus melleus]